MVANVRDYLGKVTKILYGKSDVCRSCTWKSAFQSACRSALIMYAGYHKSWPIWLTDWTFKTLLSIQLLLAYVACSPILEQERLAYFHRRDLETLWHRTAEAYLLHKQIHITQNMISVFKWTMPLEGEVYVSQGAFHEPTQKSQTPYTRQQSIEKTAKTRRVFTFPPAFIRGRISLVVVTHRQTCDAVVLPYLQSPW